MRPNELAFIRRSIASEKGYFKLLRCYFDSISQELDEDVVITLTAKDPQAPKNKIRFDHNSGV